MSAAINSEYAGARRVDGRNAEGRALARYRATLLHCCKGEPSPLQHVLADLGARALLRADTVGPADHSTYVMLVDVVAEVLTMLPAAKARVRLDS